MTQAHATRSRMKLLLMHVLRQVIADQITERNDDPASQQALREKLSHLDTLIQQHPENADRQEIKRNS